MDLRFQNSVRQQQDYLRGHADFTDDHVREVIEAARTSYSDEVFSDWELFLGRPEQGAHELVVLTRKVPQGFEALSVHPLRDAFLDDLGTDDPLLVLQTLAQEVGVTVQVGRQRNKFIFGQKVLVPAGTKQTLAGTRASVVTTVSPPNTPHSLEFFTHIRRVGTNDEVAVAYAYCTDWAKYTSWLDGDGPSVPDIAYDRCFISYGEPDAEFASQLRDELARRGVDCWLYSLDSTFGARSWQEITKEIQSRARFIVICSGPALVRDAVRKELEFVVEHDPQKIIAVSRDDLWNQPGFVIARGERNLKPFLAERNYADFSVKRHFAKQVDRLMLSLTRPSDAI